MSVWLKVTAILPSPPEDWSAWIELFERCGHEGTVQTDEPPTLSTYLVPGENHDLATLKDLLIQRGAKIETEEIEEIDWAESWKQFFKPVEIGERFLVRPSWEPKTDLNGRLEICLDPGQAFGTGDHPTTRMCLIALESVDLKVKNVADIGCGSGILSIGAMLLGAKSVHAVDLDPVSVESTIENARRNNVSVSACQGAGFEPLDENSFEVVVSNIISAAIISLTKQASERIPKKGNWIISGIIKDNWPDVESATTKHGFKTVSKFEDGEWVAAILVR